MKEIRNRRDFVKTIAAATAANAVSPLFAGEETIPDAEQSSTVIVVSKTSSQKPVFNRIPDTRYELQGILREYITAITEN
jgi:hypothetical protein